MNNIDILKYQIAKVELPLVNCQKGTILFDLTEFKNSINELQEKVKEQNLNINNVEEFETLRAKLNAFSKQVNDEKIKVKNQYLAPYTDFENQVKECIALIKNASLFIDEQLKTYQKQQEQILREEFIEMWKTFNKDKVVPYERIEQDNWFLKKSSKKKVLVEMQQLSETIDREINTIKLSIADENEQNLVIDNYYNSLDIGKELGDYAKWKNTIKATEKIVVETIKEEPVKTIQEKEENVVKPKYETLNKEITRKIKQDKQVQVIISFTEEEEFIDFVLNWLTQNHVKYNYRKNNL